MSIIKIYYHQAENTQQTDYEYFSTSPISLDGVGFEPITTFETAYNKSIYYTCPAWSHKAKRTFIIRSPVDLNISIDVENQSIWVKGISQEQFDDWFFPTFANDGWCLKEKVTLQISIPMFMFWTKHKNIWVEQRSHSLTSVNNNFSVINGWFNLSSWIRPISFAFDVVDPSKPIVIKRGDPIYEVSFYSNNLDNKIKLIKKDLPYKTYIQMRKNVKLKDFISRISHKFIFKKQESKCPFAFLWNKTPQDKG